MELNSYQQRVIDELTEFLARLENTQRIDRAFHEFWAERGVTGMDVYKNNVPNVPHVCAKVPTAGGKTYIAVNALKPIFDAFSRRNPKRPAFVVWMVPSLTILDQTVKAFTNPDHPYRQRLNLLFRNQVEIYQKKDLLLGAGFSLDSVRGQLSIVVMSFDSLRATNKENRKVYQDNGYLASFLAIGNEDPQDGLLSEYDPSALINVLRQLKPVVVVDESHNAESALSIEMLRDLNPHFIFDLTATPKNNSNILSFVDAMQLKKLHMVKLPVIVANKQDRHGVIEAALIMRLQLEDIAIQEEANGGRYIRPIVLFQAQPKTADDNTTFEKIKETLIALRIPSEQIKIKTAAINELKNIDLLSRDCPVRYIITVNALKEGWDCPFAYILASLADKSSSVDVEQILGRVLRMPYVQEHGHELLNMSYVFTASNRFTDTLQSVVKALNRAGFSDRDYRALSVEELGEITKIDHQAASHEQEDLFNANIEMLASSINSNNSEIDVNRVNQDWNRYTANLPAASGNVFIEQVKAQASQENQVYEEQANTADSEVIPLELEVKMNKHRMKDIFRDDALHLKLPQFFIKVETGGWFDDDDALQLLERDLLLKDFKLANLDSTVSFDDVDTEMYRVDLEQIGKEEYAPKPFKVDQKNRQRFNALILSQSRDNQIRNLSARLFDLIGNLYPIDDADAKRYLTRIVETMESHQIRDCLERDIAYVRKIRNKINALANEHANRNFFNLLDVEKISLHDSFAFPATIAPKSNAPAIPKSLYIQEGAIGDFEHRIIKGIANLDNIEWWHRNLSRGKGFRINGGFLNQYPDFILKTHSGRIVVVETKGDDRDNSDSRMKLKIGKRWEAMSDKPFKYMMIFDSNPVDGAESLADALKKLEQM